MYLQKIRWIDEIDAKLRNSTHTERNDFESKYADIITEPTIKQRYTYSELDIMHKRKESLISSLEKEGRISDEEYAKWILSEDFNFTPKFILE